MINCGMMYIRHTSDYWDPVFTVVKEYVSQWNRMAVL